MRQYAVIVEHLGPVYAGTDGLTAIKTYNTYARQSERTSRRHQWTSPQVTLLRDNHVVYEYIPQYNLCRIVATKP